MTIKEVTTFTSMLIDFINAFNEAKRIEIGVMKGNADVAFDICERTGLKIDTLTTALRYCDVRAKLRYDISGLIYQLEMTYHDTHKVYKANSNFRINY